MGFSQIEANLLGTWSDDDLTPTSWLDSRYNDIWGDTINGLEIAIIGSTEGVHFIDVTDPTTPTELAFVAGKADGDQLVHRDYHSYNGYLYCVADEGPSSLQVIDMHGLPNSVEVVYDSDELLVQAHNVFIDTSRAMLYACNGNGFELQLISIADPANPVSVASYPNADLSLPQIHDMYVRNDTAYLNGAFQGFLVVDFTEPTVPVLLGTMTDYPQSGYNHSGWLSEDGKTYFLCDETWSLPVKALDVSDMSDLKVISTFSSDIDPLSIVHNPLIRGDYLFAGYYYDGLQVFDVSDPANPTKVRQYFTSNIAHNTSYEGAWGVYPNLPSGNIIVGDMQEGLFIIDVNLGLEPMMEDTTMVEDSTVMGIFDAQAFELKIAPNPATNVFNIEGLSDGEQVQMINLYNQAGQLVWRKKVSNNYDKTIVRPEVPHGFYMIELVNNKGERYLGKIMFE